MVPHNCLTRDSRFCYCNYYAQTMTIYQTTELKIQNLENFHLHLYCTKDRKYLIWSTAESWDWQAFLENGSFCSRIKRLVQIRRDESGREEIIKDVRRP